MTRNETKSETRNRLAIETARFEAAGGVVTRCPTTIARGAQFMGAVPALGAAKRKPVVAAPVVAEPTVDHAMLADIYSDLGYYTSEFIAASDKIKRAHSLSDQDIATIATLIRDNETSRTEPVVAEPVSFMNTPAEFATKMLNAGYTANDIYAPEVFDELMAKPGINTEYLAEVIAAMKIERW